MRVDYTQLTCETNYVASIFGFFRRAENAEIMKMLCNLYCQHCLSDIARILQMWQPYLYVVDLTFCFRAVVEITYLFMCHWLLD